MCLPFLLLLDNCFSCLQPDTARLQLFCQSVCAVFAFVLHLLSFMSTYVKHGCYRRKSRFAIQCRRVGRQRCTSHRRKRSIHVQSRFALRPHIVFLPVVQSIAVWFLSSKTMNRIMHSLVGNISMKQLMEVLQNKLGMSQPGLKEAAKRLLQDTQRKQKVDDFYQQNSFFEIGKLLLDMPSSTQTVKTYGKGAGKGASSSSRTPWTALQPRPLHLFSDEKDQTLEQIICSKPSECQSQRFFPSCWQRRRTFFDHHFKSTTWYDCAK